ncbi:hypothetical protein [Syntrophus aciditrophicus]|uniref:Hypothetical membrane protein n=1 Tax=Syntrophus aciditrophicus (strain SB) TaxID=56780 RepID=Q2LPM8_SYNAS|nr:hypothetical protein [Syntrophus aciditrophicus]ABC76230.1 hypothetical membrane protein [Syntrophus aciditrophicus SB]OPY17651.1 MAG: Eukaryotic cytochrome b561 [Syntrophus sp. PtaB.Bin075]
MNWFFLHVGFMLTAAGFLMIGVTVAMTLRRNRWWLKIHRRAGIGGAGLMASGFLAAVLMISLSGRPHFGNPHTWLGGLTLAAAFSTLTLGFLQFRLPAYGGTIRWIHRMSGRLTVILAIVTISFGLILVGFL